MNKVKKYGLWISIFLMKSPVFAQETDLQQLVITPVFQNQHWQAETSFYAQDISDSVKISRFCLYISNIELIYDDGNVYQNKTFYHLVDTDETTTLKFAFPGNKKASITSIRLHLGVDSLACVSGALEGALDPVNGMYWTWNSGYINAKLEGSSPKIPSRDKKFEFHIGGYLSPHASLRKAEITINQATPLEEINVQAELSTWFKNLNLKENHTIVMPGEEAMKMADRYVQMFSQKTAQ